MFQQFLSGLVFLQSHGMSQLTHTGLKGEENLRSPISHFKEGLPKMLTVFILLLLTYGHHLQAESIRQLNLALQARTHQKVEDKTYAASPNDEGWTMHMEVLQREMAVFKKGVQLDLVRQMQWANDSLSNLTKIIEQLDEGLSALQSFSLYRQFLQRKAQIQRIMASNVTIDRFQEDYERYSSRLYYSLNNVPNPYFDVENRTNHTLEMAELAQKQHDQFQSKYNIDKYSHEISMCVVVPTRNNAYNHRYIYNLQSILNQNYTNYKIVIIDDHSDDGTGILIQKYLRRHRVPSERVTVVRKGRREGSLAAIYEAVHNYCQNYAVTLEVDGDDELIGQYVFKLFNAVYQSKNPGIAYSSHIFYAEEKGYISEGYSQPYSTLSIQKQNYRKVIQKFGHLRSFRTELFLRIKEQDFRDVRGQFYLAAGDEAYVFPILEMSCKSIEYINEVNYLYNGDTGNNVRKALKKQQVDNAIEIRLKKKYSCLEIYQNPMNFV